MNKYLSWKARMNRKEFFVSMLIITIVELLIIWMVSPAVGPFQVDGEITISIVEARETIYNVLSIPNAYFSICYVIQRFRDMNKTGWYYLWLLVPFINIYFIFLLLFKKGSVNETQNNLIQ